jgi:hypothetical protein
VNMKNFKRHFLFILLTLMCCQATFSQTQFDYSYDPAGNRIMRKVFAITPMKKQDTQEALSQLAEAGDEITDSLGQESMAGMWDEQNNMRFALFPNPTMNYFTIHLDDQFMQLNSKKLLLYDMKGGLLETRMVIAQDEKFELTMLPAGSYIVKIMADGFYREWRVVKQ